MSIYESELDYGAEVCSRCSGTGEDYEVCGTYPNDYVSAVTCSGCSGSGLTGLARSKEFTTAIDNEAVRIAKARHLKIMDDLVNKLSMGFFK